VPAVVFIVNAVAIVVAYVVVIVVAIVVAITVPSPLPRLFDCCISVACTTVMRRHVTIYASRHDTDTTSGKPTRCNVAEMVCVVSATWRRHVSMSVVLGGKNP
jgi:hypothetical protein